MCLNFTAVPELKSVVGEENVDALIATYKGGNETCKEELQKCFTGLMTREDEHVKTNLETLVKKLETQGEALETFVKKLETQGKVRRNDVSL